MDTHQDDKIKDTIEVIGMTCVNCARTLENEFRKFNGIDYSVSFKDKCITVAYSPSAYTREIFEKAIESHGYKVKGKSY